MKAIEKNEFKQGVAVWRLAQIISHMKDKTDIDLRTYMLTANIKKGAVPSEVAHGCYQAIKSHLNLGRKEVIPQHRLPGMLWSYDDTGGRTGRIDEVRSHPHLHAILILSTKMDTHELDIPVLAIEERLGKVEGVARWDGYNRPVHLTRFLIKSEDEARSPYEQLINYCSYALKAEALFSRSHQHSPNFLTSGALPFESFDDEKRAELEKSYERVVFNLDSPRTRFRHISRPVAQNTFILPESYFAS